MATFFHGNETLHAKEIASFFCSILASNGGNTQEVEAFFKELEALIEGNLPKFVGLLLDNTNRALDTNSPDVEPYLQLLAALITRIAKGNELKSLVEKFCEIVGATADRPDVRLKSLSSLFNFIAPTNPLRITVLSSMVSYSITHHHVAHIAPYFPGVTVWCTKAKCDVKQSRDLYTLVAKAIQPNKSFLQANLDTLVSFLKEYQGADASDLAKASIIARLACIHAIAIPSVFHLDKINSFDMVQALKKSKDATDKSVFELFQILGSGTLAQYEAFEKANKKLFPSLSLTSEACLTKMRLVTISEHLSGKSEVALSEIADVAKLPAGETELWVIRAVKVGLVKAKISQVDSSVIVSSSQRRVATEICWKEMQGKVQAWRTNLQSLALVMGNARQAAQASS